MATTLSHTFAAPRPATSIPEVALVVMPQRAFPGAVAASLVLLVANTTTEAEAAKPASFDICSIATHAQFPESASSKAGALELGVGDELISKVREIGMMEDGWHRADSIGATPSAVNDAERFLRSIDWRRAEKPTISLSEDGEINFLWQNDTLYLDLGFVGDGTYSFYGKSGDGKVFLGDDQQVGESLPAGLASLMSAAAA
ncbi:hypothetical protein [Sphingobium sp. CFD-1]|uniref:hypothetical protein n=1 Tax=Sphingobium sp. CFD-1 TaxID=2878545 RepID=UPI00214B182E|nr:hypothetical protein [Sphingobium sp. CFD-1]